MGLDIEGLKNISTHIEVMKEFSLKELEDVLLLEKECFPKEWQYPDAKEYYAERLKDEHNINIFLKHSDRTVGYMLAVPFVNSFDDLKEYDLSLRSDKDNNEKIYIETGSILPEYSKIGGFERLVLATFEEGKRRGVKKFSVHARVVNKVNNKFRKIFAGKITESHSIAAWHYGGNEPYEYIEWGI